MGAAGCGGSAAIGPTTARLPTATPAPVASPSNPVPARTQIVRVDPGTLPQTGVRPGFGRRFQVQIRTLWAAIVGGSTRIGRAAFFPESAYRQLKAIAYPTADYKDRLLALYDLDIAAYHAHLGARPSAARLVDVAADAALAQWIPPGVCENSVGYWHLPGTRLVYTTGRTRYSVGVYSLISWRGVWYVIHLGPNPRPVNVGTLDDPQAGPGVAGPAGGC